MSSLEPEAKSGPPGGLVHLYEGDGKGKTTAAAGLAVRAAGQGKAVLFCQFLKNWPSGELSSLEKLGVEVLRAKVGSKFLFQMNPEELQAERSSHRECFWVARSRILSGKADLVVLDEVLDACNAQLLDIIDVEALLRERGPVEIVLTGREPPDCLRELADYHTRFACVRHPFQQGIQARKGIEY